MPNPKSGNKATAEDLQGQIQKIAEIDSLLLGWENDSLFPLRLVSTRKSWHQSPEALDKDIKAIGKTFEEHVLYLQTLALKLAYENLRILVHRPLLLYQMVSPRDLPNDPFRNSVEACRAAALEIAEATEATPFRSAAVTYAAPFASMHLFTAGVTLSIMASLDPLSLRAHEAKVGLQKIMAMQTKLKATSAVAAQGLELLQRLTRLLMEKELHFMLDTPTRQAVAGQSARANSPVVPPAAVVASPGHQGVGSALTDGVLEEAFTTSPPTSGWDFCQDPAMMEAFIEFEKCKLSNAFMTPVDCN